MIPLIIAIFVLGYASIAMEHKLRVDKAASALLMFGLIWSVYAICSPGVNVGAELLEHIGSTCETLIFLIGAMTVVEIIDRHGGFFIITRRITTRNKFLLLWLLAGITFFMSAVLDNMTTTIVMVMVCRRMLPEKADRLLFAGIMIIAANSGGAWSPIGDVTTIMLWMRGNVTTVPLVKYLLLPSIVSVLTVTFPFAIVLPERASVSVKSTVTSVKRSLIAQRVILPFSSGSSHIMLKGCCARLI